MKLTPLDIQQQEFKMSIRGYDRIEVQAFLGTVADAVENLLKENAALKERSEMMEGQIINLRQKEAALNDLLMSTHAMAENMKQSAQREADLTMKEAESKAEDVLKQAQLEYGALQREITGLQRQRIIALEKLRGLLHTFHKMIELEELDADSLDPFRRDE